MDDIKDLEKQAWAKIVRTITEKNPRHSSDAEAWSAAVECFGRVKAAMVTVESGKNMLDEMVRQAKDLV